MVIVAKLAAACCPEKLLWCYEALLAIKASVLAGGTASRREIIQSPINISIGYGMPRMHVYQY